MPHWPAGYFAGIRGAKHGYGLWLWAMEREQSGGAREGVSVQVMADGPV
jgi:hypothetical protein